MTITEIAYIARRKAGLTKEEAPNSIIVAAINGIQARFASHFPDTFLAIDTDTLSEDDVSVALPADYQLFDEFRIGNYVYLLIGEEDLRFKVSTDMYCYVRGDYIYFNPAASEGDIYTLRYLAAPTAITAMANSPEIPTEFHRDLAIMVAYDLVDTPTPTLLEEYRDAVKRFNRRPRKAYPIRSIKTVYQDEGDQYISS